MSKTTEVSFDISSGVLSGSGITIVKATLISNDCIDADQPITTGNIKYVTVLDDGGLGYNDAIVENSTVSSFDASANYLGFPVTLVGEFVVIELYQNSVNNGTVYFDISGLADVNSPADLTYRIISENYARVYPTVYGFGNRYLLACLGSTLDKEFILKITLAQSFSNLKRSYQTIQNEKTFKTNDDYLRKLKTFKTRKNNCQH